MFALFRQQQDGAVRMVAVRMILTACIHAAVPRKGVGPEWRLLKGFNKKGLLMPIKDLLRNFIGKETILCLANLSAKL